MQIMVVFNAGSVQCAEKYTLNVNVRFFFAAMYKNSTLTFSVKATGSPSSHHVVAYLRLPIGQHIATAVSGLPVARRRWATKLHLRYYSYFHMIIFMINFVHD